MTAVPPAAGPVIPQPYRGLVPYTEADADLFFGREADRQLITANLYASRLTVLYGASGVGKSSVLRAAVAYRLRQDPKQVVVVANRWHDAPLTRLRSAVIQAAERVQPAQQPQMPQTSAIPVGDEESLVDLLRRSAAGTTTPLVIILDQFEEFFLYQGAPADADSQTERVDRSFEAELARAINSPSCPATFLISLREEALSKLDRFERRIPSLFDNYLRIDHLDGRAARDAIVRPLAVISAHADPDRPYTIEPALVDAVIQQVRMGNVVVGQVGRGTLPPAAPSTPAAPAPPDEAIRVVAPYLQLVMTRLWEEEQRRHSRVLRLATLDALGGAERIVRTHLDSVMAHLKPAEQETAAHIFHFLVTPAGSKIALDVDTLSSFADLPTRRVAGVVQHLAQPGLSVLRSVAAEPNEAPSTRYEIFHDVLAPAILDWRARYFSRVGLSRQVLLLGFGAAAGIAVVEALPAVPPLVLALVRGVGLLAVNVVPVMQVYRWFSRYIGLARASLAVAPYGGPNMGILLGVLLTVFWYASTRWSVATSSPNPLGAISTRQYLFYLVTAMPSVVVAFVTFLVMRSAGQVAHQVFRRFDLGFYGTYAAVCLLLAALAVLGALGRLPPSMQIVLEAN